MIPEIKKILYATDLTKNSAYAFFYAVKIAKRFNASIVILHAVEPFHHPMVEELLEKSLKQKQDKAVEEIQKRIQDFCKKTETQIGFPCAELVSKSLVTLGYPVEEILKTAEEEACDVILLGTHGKGFLMQTFLGSVAGSVLERSRKPVFVIPLPSEKTDMDWEKI